MNQEQTSISEEVIRAAKLNPNGWVYKIDAQYGNIEDVPVAGIIGSWQVDAHGNIVGEFRHNPLYKAKNEETKEE